MDSVADAEIESTKKQKLAIFIARVMHIIKGTFNYIVSLWKKLFCKSKSFYFQMLKRSKIAVFTVCIATVMGVIIFAAINMIDENEVPHKLSTAQKSMVSKNKDLDVAIKMQSQNISKKDDKVLSDKLSQIQKLLNQAALSEIKLGEISTQNNAIFQAILAMKKNASAIKSASLNSAHISEKNQISTNEQVRRVESELSKISHAVAPVHYLPIKDLPFKVVGLDFWNDKPMASIGIKDMNGVMHYRLMGQGMSFDCHGHCTNWTLEKIKTDPNALLFGNQKGQKIKVII